MSDRIPSFNDFSPGTLQQDIRPILTVIDRHSGDDKSIFAAWIGGAFASWDSKRVKTNLPATLGNTGLTIGRPMTLSEFGRRVMTAKSAKEAAEIFCVEIIKKKKRQILDRCDKKSTTQGR